MKTGASFLALILICATVRAAEISVVLPEGATVRRGLATATDTKLETGATLEGRRVTFPKLPAKANYDLRIDLADGRVLQGVDLGWYNAQPPAQDAGELSDDDREDIRVIVQEVPGFYNRNELLLLSGNHDRATLLVQLIRDSAFHSDKGGEIVWHIELWYFKNQHGGWEKVQQQNKVLRRERFRSQRAFDDDAGKIRWLPALGAVHLSEQAEKKEITLPVDALSAHKVTAPASQP